MTDSISALAVHDKVDSLAAASCQGFAEQTSSAAQSSGRIHDKPENTLTKTPSRLTGFLSLVTSFILCDKFDSMAMAVAGALQSRLPQQPRAVAAHMASQKTH